MYTHCHLCARSFGRNTVVSHMPIGRRLAFDPERGRLWVVCRRCGEWNLTPLEERWEAVEECERLYADAPVRTSTANVGLARLDGLELIRVGDALRDELANWRYLPRLRLRRRMAAVRATVGGVLGGCVFGGSILLGISSGSAGATILLGVMGAFWGTGVTRLARPSRAIRFRDRRGGRHFLGGGLVPAITLTTQGRPSDRGASRQVGVRIAVGRDYTHFTGEDALLAVAAILPRLNWQGGSEAQLARAARIVDEAEAKVGGSPGSKRRRKRPSGAKQVWQRIALANWPADGVLQDMRSDARLAMEMAVTEALEWREVGDDADSFVAPSNRAEEIAAIADDMFVPSHVTEWIGRLRRTGGRQTPPGE